jgi:membrane protease YdiL (CAAX protease family)
MATDFDPYRILGIDRTAFSDDIYAAYQRALDEAGDDEARRREIEAAYAILGNIEQRREYDRRLSEREAMGVAAASPEAIAATAGAPKQTTVAWTRGDLVKAMILPGILVVLNLIAFIASDVDTEDLTEEEYIINFGFGFLLEVALLGLAYHFGIRKHKLSWRAFGFHWPERLRWWFPLAIAAAALATIFIYVSILTAVSAEPQGNIPENVYDYVIPVVMLGILSVLVAPFVEEIFFRAFLYQGLAKMWGPNAGIAVSGFIFGLIHVADADSLVIAPAIAVIGAIFAWAFMRTGSIYPSLIAHILFNLTSYASGFAQ